MSIALAASLFTLLVTMAAGGDVEKYEAWLNARAKEPNMHRLPSGALIKKLRSSAVEGAKSPRTDSLVELHYDGFLPDGTKFESTRARRHTVMLRPNQVVRGWGEVLQLMREGDEWEVVLPAALAYGEAGFDPEVPPNSPVYFVAELIRVRDDGKPAEEASSSLRELIGRTHDEL